MFFPRSHKWVHRGGIIGIINIHHFIYVYIDFLVNSGKDGTLFCRHPNHGICCSDHCQTSKGLNFLPLFWRACWLGAAFGVWWQRGVEGRQRSTSLFLMHCGCHAAEGAAVVFIVVLGSHLPSQKAGQARRRCGRQPTVLFGFATLVPRARSTQTIPLHRISSCWAPSIQSCIQA